MLLIMTGNGKGKTTSAIGAAIRALGWGKKVGLILFDKGGSHYGEQHIFDLLQEIISKLWETVSLFDEKVKKQSLPETFSKIIRSLGKNGEARSLVSKYGLPLPLAEFYA